MRVRQGVFDWGEESGIILAIGRRANRVSQVIGLGILLSVPSSILAVALYFILRAAIGSHVVITTVSVTLAVGPFALFQIGFWPGGIGFDVAD